MRLKWYCMVFWDFITNPPYVVVREWLTKFSTTIDSKKNSKYALDWTSQISIHKLSRKSTHFGFVSRLARHWRRSIAHQHCLKHFWFYLRLVASLRDSFHLAQKLLALISGENIYEASSEKFKALSTNPSDGWVPSIFHHVAAIIINRLSSLLSVLHNFKLSSKISRHKIPFCILYDKFLVLDGGSKLQDNE